jgi:hypothetical protein
VSKLSASLVQEIKASLPTDFEFRRASAVDVCDCQICRLRILSPAHPLMPFFACSARHPCSTSVGPIRQWDADVMPRKKRHRDFPSTAETPKKISIKLLIRSEKPAVESGLRSGATTQPNTSTRHRGQEGRHRGPDSMVRNICPRRNTYQAQKKQAYRDQIG